MREIMKAHLQPPTAGRLVRLGRGNERNSPRRNPQCLNKDPPDKPANGISTENEFANGS